MPSQIPAPPVFCLSTHYFLMSTFWRQPRSPNLVFVELSKITTNILHIILSSRNSNIQDLRSGVCFDPVAGHESMLTV